MASEIHLNPLYREVLQGTWRVELWVGRKIYKVFIKGPTTSAQMLLSAFFHATGRRVLREPHEAFEVLAVNKVVGMITGRLIPGTPLTDSIKVKRGKRPLAIKS